MSFVSDTFADANGTLLTAHTGQTGATWAFNPNWSGNFTIESNQAFVISNAVAVLYASGVPSSADYDVQATFNFVSPVGFCGIMGRLSATANNWYWVYYDGTGWFLDRGGNNTIGSHPQQVAVGSTHVVKLSMRGSTITVFVDGIQIIQVTDTGNPSAGHAGVAGGGGTGSPTIALSDFTATNAGSGPGVAVSPTTV